MFQMLERLALVLYVLATLGACVTVPATDSQGEPASEERVETPDKPRTKRTMLAIGGALLLAAIIAHEAEDVAKDAVRDAVDP